MSDFNADSRTVSPKITNGFGFKKTSTSDDGQVSGNKIPNLRRSPTASDLKKTSISDDVQVSRNKTNAESKFHLYDRLTTIKTPCLDQGSREISYSRPRKP